MIVIGLMSGTSADGVDAAICDISGAPPKLDAFFYAYTTTPYTPQERQAILDAYSPDTGRVDRLCQLNFMLGHKLAECAQGVAVISGWDDYEQYVDLIGSHGQTVWHQVDPDGRVSATLQLGEAAIIAERMGVTTVSNFRPRDVAAGGQGAPLTSYVDWLLFRHADHWRAMQNIGGIGNVTFLPPLSDDKSVPLAFDTGPGNALIDAAIAILTDGAMTYDDLGKMAARGSVDEKWLRRLLNHPYFERALPKTTGRELFSLRMAQELVQEGQTRDLSAESILATLTALTAKSIADAYKRFAPQLIQEVIVSGGGADNKTLMGMLQHYLSEAAVTRGIGEMGRYKEALVFAVLAYETWHGRPGNLPSLTGASHPVVLGQITPGRNYQRLIQQTWCAK